VQQNDVDFQRFSRRDGLSMQQRCNEKPMRFRDLREKPAAAGAGWTALKRGRRLPLIRASEDCDPENLVGVRFPMVDASDRTKRVICLVTYAALHDRATFDGNGDDWMRAWLEHRGAIETLASYNYDHAMNTESGEVVIETEDLTPIG
jgi:hypothetical protein